jgi:protein-S-isoprenylcysteine O-methyltransferase Ste14
MSWMPLVVMLPTVVVGVLGAGHWSYTPRWAVLVVVLTAIMLAWSSGWSVGTAARRKVENDA